MINVSNVLSGAGSIENEVPYGFDTVEVFGRTFPIVGNDGIHYTLTRLSKEEIQVHFTTHLEVKIPCDRCLTDVTRQFDLEFDDKVSFQDLEENEDIKSGYVIGYNLDMDKLVYDEILVNWPDKVLCSEDCKGVCGSCGKNLNLGTCDCQDAGPDLRMAVIRDIFKDYKEV